ncbi:MAG: hypothetical protein HYU27_06175 [Acidobacteria bacterium]|nr:hypothetical protein [Acidobacteriota bacterium]
MRHRFLVSMIVMLAFIATVALTPAPMAGQAPKAAAPAKKTATAAKAWTPPKTPWGDPDLQGVYTSDDYIGAGLQRNPQFGDRLYLSDEEIAQREATIANQAKTDLIDTVSANQRAGTGPPGHWGERARRPPRQTSLIVDPPNGRIPDVLPEAARRPVPFGAGVADPNPASWEDFSYYIRCITRGVAGSILPVIYGNGTQIVQAPGVVTLLQEMVHEARVIPLDGRPHAGPNIRTYMGDSRGHFEGNTLVVETTNFLDRKTAVQGGNGGAGPPTTDAMRLLEKFTKVAPDTIKYELTIDDPKTYTRPWTVSFPIVQEPGYQNFEYACHEGNYAMFNSLSGARAQEKQAEEAAKKQ